MMMGTLATVALQVLCVLCCVLLCSPNGALAVDDSSPPPPPPPESACTGVVKRAQWNAAKSTNVTYQLKPVAVVIVHHTAGERCAGAASCRELVRNIQAYHQTQHGWSDIGYNFLIGNSLVYEGIGWHRTGAHLRGHNDRSIGVAFIGNFDQDRPTPRTLTLLANLIQCGLEQGELSEDYRLYGALQLQATNSPGRWLYAKLQELDHWTADV